MAAVVSVLAVMRAPLAAHPHPGDVVTETFRGRVAEVDLARGTLTIDALDRQTRKVRNYLFFLDPRVKVHRGKQKASVMDLMPGDAVVCEAEVELDERGGRTRFIAFDVRFDLQARPAVY